MARTSNVSAWVEPSVKLRAEAVLDRLGMPMSNAIELFLRQVAIQGGLPFEVKLPLAYEALTQEEFDAAMEKGLADVKAGRLIPAVDQGIETGSAVACDDLVTCIQQMHADANLYNKGKVQSTPPLHRR